MPRPTVTFLAPVLPSLFPKPPHFTRRPPLCTAPRLATLRTHLATSNILHPCLSLRETCAIAAHPVPPGTDLFRVPFASALLARPRKHLSWSLVLAAELLASRRGTHASYISSLPPPPGAGPACLAEGVDVVARRADVFGLGAHVRDYWNGLRSEFDLGVGAGLLDGVAWPEFVWACAVVGSRAFRVDGGDGEGGEGGEFALLPGVDMMNHSVVCRTEFRTEDGKYCIRSALGFEEGEEVLVSYGAKANDDFVLYYGFVEGNNVGESVRITAEDFRDLVGVARDDERWRFLQEAGLDGDVCNIRRDSIDDALLACLRVLLSSDEAFEAMREIPRRPLSLANELQVWGAVASACDAFLSALPPIDVAARRGADDLRRATICSAEWDWGAVGGGKTVGEALYVAERREVLEAAKARVLHFAAVSERIGRVTTVLMPPSQSLLSTTVWDEAIGEGTTGVRSFSV